jgi:hypothetical protein
MIRGGLIGFLFVLAFASNALAETAELFASDYWADSDKSTCAIGFYGTGRLRDGRLLMISGTYLARFDAPQQATLAIHVSAQDHSNNVWKERRVISARFRFAKGNTEGMRELQEYEGGLWLFEPQAPNGKNYGQLAKMALEGSSIGLQLDRDEIFAMQLPPFMSSDRYVRRQFEQCWEAVFGKGQ